MDDEAEPQTDTEYYQDILRDMVQVGANMVQHIGLLSVRAIKPEDINTVTMAFERTSRAVRRTILLAQKLAQPPRAQKAPKDPAQARTQARTQLIRGVENAIHGTAKPGAAEALHAEFLDRLDSEDLDDDLTTRPVAEIIAEIVADLGLPPRYGKPPGTRRTPEALATLAAKAQAPSSSLSLRERPGVRGAPQVPAKDWAAPPTLHPPPQPRPTQPSPSP